jgi:hypothetical protein
MTNGSAFIDAMGWKCAERQRDKTGLGLDKKAETEGQASSR